MKKINKLKAFIRSVSKVEYVLEKEALIKKELLSSKTESKCIKKSK